MGFVWFIGGLVWFFSWIRGGWIPAIILAVPLGIMPFLGRPQGPEGWAVAFCLFVPWLPLIAKTLWTDYRSQQNSLSLGLLPAKTIRSYGSDRGDAW